MIYYILLAPIAGLFCTLIVGALFDDWFADNGESKIVVLWITFSIIMFFVLLENV